MARGGKLRLPTTVREEVVKLQISTTKKHETPILHQLLSLSPHYLPSSFSRIYAWYRYDSRTWLVSALFFAFIARFCGIFLIMFYHRQARYRHSHTLKHGFIFNSKLGPISQWGPDDGSRVIICLVETRVMCD